MPLLDTEIHPVVVDYRHGDPPAVIMFASEVFTFKLCNFPCRYFDGLLGLLPLLLSYLVSLVIEYMCVIPGAELCEAL